MSIPALLELRLVRPEDEPFLTDLFTVIERERLAGADLKNESLQTAINHELIGQRRHYRALNEDATHCVIVAQSKPAGRVIFWDNREEIRLAELAVAPAFRGLGIGSAVIETLKAQARQTKRPLRLHVEKYNYRQPHRFYQQLGFQVIEDRKTHWFMEWDAERAGPGPVGAQLKITS